MKFEMAKPEKDGLEKTPDEYVDAFSNVLKRNGIANNTFLRNSGFTANLSMSKSKSLFNSKSMSKSKSKSLPVQDLEEQLKAERAIAAAQRVVIHRLSAGLEASQAHLEHARQHHEKVLEMLNTWQ